MQLSIITINYNNLAGLKKTAESVLAQTWRDFEWIIIDGGSTDGSKEYISNLNSRSAGTDACLSKNPNANITYWCSEPDKGVYNAMNKGIAKANGEYLNFMNSGDCFASSDVLEKVFDGTHTADILYGYMMRKTIDGIPNNASMMKPKVYWYDFYSDTFPHQSSFIRKRLFEKLGYYDESYKALADWKFFIKAMVYNDTSCEFIPEKLSIYECGGISDLNTGLIECARLRKEMFPTNVENDIILIKDSMEYARIKKHFLLRKALGLLRRLSIKLDR